MKVAIIGCTHAGIAAVREIIRQDPTTEVNIYERNDNISFLSCGIALYLNGRVKQLEDMFYDSAEDIRTENIHVNLRHDVIRINRQKKELMVQNMDDFTVKREKYDKIIMCTGSMVSLPPIKGVNHARVMLCKNYEQAQLLHEKVKDAQRVALVGGGYVNVELAESLVDTNHEVTLFQSHEDILNNYVDTPLSDKVIKLLNDHHVKVETSSKVVSFTDKVSELLVTTADGREFATDVAGDLRTIHYNSTNAPEYIPLATNAVRQGTLAGINIFGNQWPEMGAQGTSAIALFGHTLAMTGLIYQRALNAGNDADYVVFEDNYRPEFMPSTTKITSIMVYEKKSLRILGAQFYSKHDVSQSANLISLAIQNQNTLKDLAFVDMLFQPYYDRPFNFINLAAQAGLRKIGLL
ncbi:FAD-dependent oxidoreductase [Pediococcus acidilactici]